MIIRIILVLFFIFPAQLCFSQPMRILFIGNSYTHYNNMPLLFEKMAKTKGIKLEVTADAKSNHSFKMHAERKELFETINSKKWDYVILQGFSRELAQDTKIIDSLTLPFAKQILDSIYASNKCANVLLYQTWGYKNGYLIDSISPKWDYQTMSDRIHSGYLYLSKKLSLSVVPVGKVWELIKENHPEINLYQVDNQHPSIAGSYLAATSFYAAIFKTIPNSSYYSNLDSITANKIQELTGTYVLMNKNRYELNKNTIEISITKNTKNKQEIKCIANYPNAKSCTWDFGDGTIQKGFTAKHSCGKIKKHQILIKIEDSCDTRIIKRIVMP